MLNLKKKKKKKLQTSEKHSHQWVHDRKKCKIYTILFKTNPHQIV